jgi:hypothetical protein
MDQVVHCSRILVRYSSPREELCTEQQSNVTEVENCAVEMKKPPRQLGRLSLQGRIVPTDGRPIETFCENTMARFKGVSSEFSDLNNFVFNNLRNEQQSVTNCQNCG